MYSKDDRGRILADFLESGMTMAAFGRVPGNPCRKTICAWLKQAEAGELAVPEREVRGRCEHRRHARYPEATKREAVRLCRKGMRPCEVARRLGVASADSVRGWARAAEKRAAMAPEEAVEMDGAGAPGEGATAEELRAALDEEVMRNRVLMELMRDPKAGDPARLSNRQKAELGERLRRDYGYSLKKVTTFFAMPKSTYEYERAAIARDAGRAARVAERVRHAFDASRGTYGYRRVRASIELGADGMEPMEVSEREVRGAMRAGRMAGRKTRRRLRYDSYEGETDERPANVPLAGDGTHDFTAPEPGRLAVTDVTEFAVGRGSKVYLSPMIDCFDGEPASWGRSLHPDAELCEGSLAGYLDGLPDGSGPTCVHSDGGGVYRSELWKSTCGERGVTRSMSRKGCCPDNARAEGFFGILKEEFYYGRDWSRASPEQFMRELDAYMGWYVHGRLKRFVEEDGSVVYDTIAGRRERLGYAV